MNPTATTPRPLVADGPLAAVEPALADPSVPPARADRQGHLWSDAVVFAGRHVEHIRQIPEKLLDVTLQPLMFVVLFSYVFGGAISVGQGSYREYIVPGMLIQTIAFGLMGPGISIANDLTEGVVDRFRTLPVHRYAYLLGHFLAELGGLIVAMTLLLGAGLAVGWRVHTDIGHVLGAFALVLLFTSAMVWLGTLVGLMVRSSDAVMGVAFMLVFPLTFLSSAFVPVATLPSALQWVAAWNPITAMVGAVRELFGNPMPAVERHTWLTDNPVAGAAGISVLILVAAFAASIHRYRTRTAD